MGCNNTTTATKDDSDTSLNKVTPENGYVSFTWGGKIKKTFLK